MTRAHDDLRHRVSKLALVSFALQNQMGRALGLPSSQSEFTYLRRVLVPIHLAPFMEPL